MSIKQIILATSTEEVATTASVSETTPVTVSSTSSRSTTTELVTASKQN